MGATGKWEPICTTDGDYIDDGTMCRNRSPVPGPYCIEGTSDPVPESLKKALDDFEAEAAQFAARFIPDHAVRLRYMAEIDAMSKSVLDDVARGKISVDEGATLANGLRNKIMDTARADSSDVGAAWAKMLKDKGLTLVDLQKKYANELFQREFEALSETERNEVFRAIIKASGRANEDVVVASARLSKLSKGLLVLTAAIAVYQVATSDRPGREAAKQGTVIGAGYAGGVIVGAVATSLVCGPAAPVCVGIFVFAGGALAAYGAEVEFDQAWK
jgi:hypothetical protein